MRSVDARDGMPARLSRRVLLAGAAAAAIPSIARASEPCPDELETQLSMHHYRLQFQSWSGPARGDGGHFIAHCVRSIASTMSFVDWKDTGLAGYVDDSAPLFAQRTYSHAEFTRQSSVLWYGSRPTDRDTRIVVPRTGAIGFDQPHTSAGAFYLPGEAMVRAAWAHGVSTDDNLADLRARAEKAKAAQFMRMSLWFSVSVQKGDRAEMPARARYHGSCSIETRGNALTGLMGLRIADETAHRAIFGGAAARALPKGDGKAADAFGAEVDLATRPRMNVVLLPSRLMVVGPDGTTPIASIGIGIVA